MERTHLIWSLKWGLWHRRSEDGGACGYTNDILQAGIFETKTAMDYDDSNEPSEYQNNQAVPIAEAREQIVRAIARQQAILDEANKRLEAFDAAR